MDYDLLEGTAYRKMMKNIPMGMMVCREGIQREVYYVNEEAYRMLGYTKDEFIAKVRKGWEMFTDINICTVLREHRDEIMSGEPFEVVSRMEHKDGRLIWVLNRVVVRTEEKMISYISMLDITKIMKQQENDRAQCESLQRQCAEDSFTKLLNRGTMERKVSAALDHTDHKSRCAYLTLDLDDFKQINDAYGHGVGDMLLLELSNLLREYFGSEGYVGRMGGDEFAAFATEVKSRAEIEHRAKKVLEGVNGVQERFGFSEKPSVSIGIAYYPECGTSFKELYNKADEALYRVKRNAKNGIAVSE